MTGPGDHWLRDPSFFFFDTKLLRQWSENKRCDTWSTVMLFHRWSSSYSWLDRHGVRCNAECGAQKSRVAGYRNAHVLLESSNGMRCENHISYSENDRHEVPHFVRRTLLGGKPSSFSQRLRSESSDGRSHGTNLIALEVSTSRSCLISLRAGRQISP